MDIPHVVVFGEHGAPLSKVSALLPTHIQVDCLTSPAELQAALDDRKVTAFVLVVSNVDAPEKLDLPLLGSCLARTPLILVTMQPHISTAWLQALLTYQALLAYPVQAVLTYPFEPEHMQAALAQAAAPTTSEPLSQADPRDLETTLDEANSRLRARSQEINTVYTVGKSVTASLDVNEILQRIVVPAVNITQADSGFVILKEGSQLYVHVVKHREELEPALLHARTSDKIAWQVIRSNRPAMLYREVKVATDLLVRAFLYVPLQVPGGDTMGVLAVVNRKRNEPFKESQLFTLSTVADFAAVALENARLFKLREAERYRLAAILQHAAEAIIVTDLDDRLWLWSDAAARLFEIPPAAQGEPLIHHVKSPELQDLFSQISTERPFSHAEINLEDGAIHNAQVSAVAGIGRMVVMQNITHLKELDRLKSEFVSTVSHDLRTPLTTVQGYIALLERAGPLNELQSKFVKTALTSLDHITALISDLLDIGRIEAGYDLEMQPFRFDELVEMTAKASRIPARDAGLTVTVHQNQTPLWVRGNSRRLRQVMENLVSNAIKYNHKGGWIDIGVSRSNDHVIVRVSDSGIGIPCEDQAHVFDRFYRVQSAETESIEGTGLGLAIVKSVIERHKGRVWVKSAVGAGSTFCFILPASEAPES
jgi:two-component system, OmpR family, phosphate regulon sensor histidine kinase PhoR